MATFLTLQNRALADATSLLQVGTDMVSRAIVQDWINDAYEELQAIRVWPWSLKDGTDTLTANSASLSLPADAGAIVSMFNTTRNWELKFIDSRQTWTEDEDTYTGNPTHYRRVGDTWTVWPTPTEADVIKIRYVYIWTALSDDADVPVIPSVFHNLLSDYAAMRICQHLAASQDVNKETATTGYRLFRESWGTGVQQMLNSHFADETLDVVYSHSAQAQIYNYDW